MPRYPRSPFKKVGASISPKVAGDVLDETILGSTTPAAGDFTQVKTAKGIDIASANALTLGSDGNYFDITGTTAITSIDTLAIGTMVTLHFDGILTLTHHATDLILPGAANITTAAGDEATFIEYATGDWRCVVYTKASGEAVVGGGAVVASGSYTGDDNVNRAIAHGLGVTPKVVILTRNDLGASLRIFGNGVIYWVSETNTNDLAVTAMDITNFYIGNATSYSNSANSNNDIFYWVAIG